MYIYICIYKYIYIIIIIIYMLIYIIKYKYMKYRNKRYYLSHHDPDLLPITRASLTFTPMAAKLGGRYLELLFIVRITLTPESSIMICNLSIG